MAQLNSPWEYADRGVVLPDHAAHRVLVTFTYPIALPANSSTALFRARVVSRSGRAAGADGRPRGLGRLAAQFACVGASQGRKVSKSTGQVANPSDPGMPRGRGGFTSADLAAGRTLGFIGLGELGPGIYDVLPLPS